MPAVLRLVLLARAMQAAGNEVRFCCPARARHRVARAGLVPVLAGPQRFGRAWRPDLVVHDPLCPDSTAMAAMSGVPTIGYLPYAHPPLSPRPTVWIDPCPPPLRERPEPDAWPVRCDAYELPGKPAPRLTGLPLIPRVCVTGVPAGSRPEDRRRARLFRRVAEGVESLVYAAARFGISQLVLPAGENERRAGARLEEAGIGRCLSDDELAGDPSMLRLRFHIAELVNGGRVLPEAARLGLTIARMPQPADLVPDMEALVR
jgi:hypothetical protein